MHLWRSGEWGEAPVPGTARGRRHLGVLGELAAAVNLSERSLRRHLAEAGSGYRRLIEEHSAERAAALLRSSERSVAEVADQLGFSDASNFSKAFKRWYGVSPDRFRQR